MTDRTFNGDIYDYVTWRAAGSHRAEARSRRRGALPARSRGIPAAGAPFPGRVQRLHSRARRCTVTLRSGHGRMPARDRAAALRQVIEQRYGHVPRRTHGGGYSHGRRYVVTIEEG
jgi:hypothetical protein